MLCRIGVRCPLGNFPETVSGRRPCLPKSGKSEDTLLVFLFFFWPTAFVRLGGQQLFDLSAGGSEGNGKLFGMANKNIRNHCSGILCTDGRGGRKTDSRANRLVTRSTPGPQRQIERLSCRENAKARKSEAVAARRPNPPPFALSFLPQMAQKPGLKSGQPIH